MDHEDTNKELTREISNSLKSGPGIMIKIASKWADAEVNKMDISREILKRPITDDSNVIVNVFSVEQTSLIKEMTEVENEQLLKRFTDIQDNDGLSKTKKSFLGNEAQFNQIILK